MSPLLRKELAFVLPPMAAIGFLMWLLWTYALPAGLIAEAVEMRTTPHAQIAAFVPLILGSVLGFGLFAHESWTGALPWLLHRPSGARSTLRAKVLAGAAGVALVGPAPLALHALVMGAGMPAAAGLVAEHCAAYAVLSCLGFSGFAIGAFCSLLRAAWSARMLLALAGAAVVFLSVRGVTLWSRASSSQTALLVLAVEALPLLLLFPACRMLGRGDDPDLPFVGGLGVAIALVALALGWPMVDASLATLQRSAREVALEDATRVRLPTGDSVLVTSLLHRPYEDSLILLPVWESRPRKPLQVLAPRSNIASHGHWDLEPFSGHCTREAWLDPSRGEILVLDLDPRDLATRATTLKLAGGSQQGRRLLAVHPLHPWRTSTGVVCGSASDSWRTTLLVDPLEQRMFTVDLAGPQPKLREWDLPGAEPLVAAVPLLDLGALRNGRIWGRGEILVGESNRYTWTETGFVGFEPSIAVPPDEAAEHVEVIAEFVDDHGLAPRVAVRSARSGEVLLDHRFAPRDGRQWRWHAAAIGASLARAPAGALLAFAWDVGEGLPPWPLDMAVAGGHRPWLLALDLLVGVAFAALVLRRFRGAPDDRARRWTWAVAVLLLGLGAYVVHLVADRRVRRRPEPLPDQRPWIEGRPSRAEAALAGG